MAQIIKKTIAEIIQNNDGVISISIEPIVVEVIVNVVGNEIVTAAAVKKQEEPKDEKLWTIPSFGNTKKINFGKKI